MKSSEISTTGIPTLQQNDHPVPTMRNGSHREREDDYFAVVAMLAPRWRIILCKNGIQFILQQHFAETKHSGAWRANSFHVSRDSLFKACVTLDLLSDPKMEQLLAKLPATARECAVQRAQK